MLILDTFANRKRLLSDLRAYFSIAVPVLENNFHIIRAEFEVYLKEYEKSPIGGTFTIITAFVSTRTCSSST